VFATIFIGVLIIAIFAYDLIARSRRQGEWKRRRR
jgi:hypothetical protein